MMDWNYHQSNFKKISDLPLVGSEGVVIVEISPGEPDSDP